MYVDYQNLESWSPVDYNIHLKLDSWVVNKLKKKSIRKKNTGFQKLYGSGFVTPTLLTREEKGVERHFFSFSVQKNTHRH